MRSCRSICSKDEVLGGTGLVEAGTYIAILLGTILAGMLAARPAIAAAAVLGLRRARLSRRPPGSARARLPRNALPINWHIIHASIELVSATMHIRRLFLAILSISFFWTIGAVLIIIFPAAGEERASAPTSRSRACSSPSSRSASRSARLLINRLLKSEVSARFAPGFGDRDGRVRAAAPLRRT